MSNKIVAVLVVPAVGDPGGLTAFSPMRLTGPRGEVLQTTYGMPPTAILASGPRALVLWWDGKLVPEGWDRLTWVMHPDRDGSPLAVHPDRSAAGDWYRIAHAACYHRIHATLGQVDALARVAVQSNRADRVVCLARADGRLVEVSP